jgi:peroxiredoxin
VIAAGERVPDFTLRRGDRSAFTAADLQQGHRTLLVFYPHAFSAVCSDQLAVYNEVLGDLAEEGVTVYGVSCDNVEVQAAFRAHLGIDIEQLSDWEPKGEACRALGVYHPGGMPERALLLVAPDGVVEWAHKAEHPGIMPGANLIFDALARSRA